MFFLYLLQASCPRAAATAADSGWAAYRRGAIAVAASHFAAADSLCPRMHGAQVGLGFVALRQEDAGAAARRFATAIASDSLDSDAWYGLGLARQRLGQTEDAVAAWRRTLTIAPHYGDAADRILAAGRDSGLTLRRRARPRELQLVSRTVGEHFEVRDPSGWHPFYIKGINLGAALPGKFPSEFPPDQATYARWIRLIAEAHANCVRLYTILPPEFYRALKDWNDTHPDRVLWVIHGVWAEAPPDDDYDDAAWKREFQREMRRVVDLVHGHAVIPGRRGHAFGRYGADVSDHVLGYIIGREWEPFTIRRFNERHRDRSVYAGRFLAVDSGTAADVWMAEQCDYLLRYEDSTWHAQRPIAYTNWPTLDPLHHPTEPTLDEERAIRRRLGLSTRTRLKEYDNDGESLDAMLVRTTAADSAGYFASYHAYPYYPDFIGLDSTYGTARSSFGPSHYFGYLTDLKRHHAGRPLIIAEYGVPSSRGNAHLQADGMHHGGHDEQEMAAIDVRLTSEIHEAGLAGGVLFAWLDEWFKHNWVVIDFELPADRTRLWSNVQDAEQHYGLLGEYAGAGAGRPVLGGDVAPWRDLPFVQSRDSVRLRVGSDEAYVYLALESPLPFDSTSWKLGIDTYRADCGQVRLPRVPDSLSVGVEFVVQLRDSGDAELRVAHSYNPYVGPTPRMAPTDLDALYNVDASADTRGADAVFDSLFVTTNRLRVTRAGRIFPARGVNRGRLRYGREGADGSTLADWYLDRGIGMIELRLPWNLLNVTDPSSRRVLLREGGSTPFATAITDGFRFVAVALRRRDGTVMATLPAGGTYTWPRWETPRSHERLKPAYAAMQRLWESL